MGVRNLGCSSSRNDAVIGESQRLRFRCGPGRCLLMDHVDSLSLKAFSSSLLPNLGKFRFMRPCCWVEQGKGAEIHENLTCIPRFFGYQFLPAAELGGCSESPGGLFNVTAVL